MILVAFEMDNAEAGTPEPQRLGVAIRRVPGARDWLLLELNGQRIILNHDEARRLVLDLEAVLHKNAAAQGKPSGG